MLIAIGVGGDSWEDLDPTAGPVRLAAILAAFISVADEIPYQVVLKAIRGLRLRALMGTLSGG